MTGIYQYRHHLGFPEISRTILTVQCAVASSAVGVIINLASSGIAAWWRAIIWEIEEITWSIRYQIDEGIGNPGRDLAFLNVLPVIRRFAISVKGGAGISSIEGPCDRMFALDQIR